MKKNLFGFNIYMSRYDVREKKASFSDFVKMNGNKRWKNNKLGMNVERIYNMRLLPR